ncbi:MAG: ABC transporter ATP-binding protein [Clostridia bacterium]
MGGGPMGMMGMPVSKAKDFNGTLKTLLSYLNKYRFALIIVFIFAIGSTIFSIIGPKILGNATTLLFTGAMAKLNGTGTIDFIGIGNTLLFILGLYVVSSIFSLVQGFTMTGVTQKLTYQMRKEISEKINRMPMNYFETRTHGEVLSRITNDIDTLSQSLNQSLTQVVTSFFTIVGIFIMMLTISWQMTLIAVLTLPLSVLVVGAIVKKSQVYFKDQQANLGKVNGQVEEVYGGHTIVRVFNAEAKVLAEFNESNKKLYDSAWKSQFFSGMMQPIMGFIGNIGYVLVSIVGGYLAIVGTITVGNILSFIQYMKSFTQPIMQVAQVSNLLQSTIAAAERVFEFLAEAEEEQAIANPTSIENLAGNVSFQHVHFGYTPEKIIIEDFSADIQDGQKIAIVGPTGAGKTTMVKLLMRFYDVNSGAILIDGHDSKSFNRAELRKMFGMVLQDTWLFNGTIMENIRYSRQNATDEEVIAAAKAAYVHHFVQTLPGGYDLILNEEASNLSQGQKQLLTIARAILADPAILILDEATSSVDTRTEQRIQKAMDNLMHGRTSFVIAHRLSTVKDADLILVMNEGDIIEQGNHQTLMELNGFYSNLYNSQFERPNTIAV